MARSLEAEFSSKASDTVAYESPTQKLFKKLEQQKQDAQQTVNNSKYLSSRALSSRLALTRRNCVQISILQGTTKLCVRLHHFPPLQYAKK